ncbi:MAG TPA: hypothetical protein VGK73_08805 [Polyangiaceae bacterium]
MNKKEQAEVEELRTRLALRFTDADTEPDIPAPTFENLTRTTGYIFNTYSMTIDAMWSEASRHGQIGSISARQLAIPLYSTRLRALRAMRRAVELECAKRLRVIDIQIAEADEP